MYNIIRGSQNLFKNNLSFIVMILQNCQTLEELWEIVDEINHKYFPENHLMPILGDGKTFHPKFAFVFINPTRANISSDPNWQGPRFPFIGTKQIWRVFHKAGMFDNELINTINNSKSWSLDLTQKVLNFLKSRAFYFTNLVKWTGHDATLPNSEKIKLFLPILKKEIEIVEPQYVVTFGLIPFESLTSQKIKLGEYYSETMKNKKLRFFDVEYGSFKTKIIPCHFPVGRGNPKKAIEILKLVNNL
jgi:DNA polymerase